MNKNIKFLKIGVIAIAASFSMAFGAVSEKCLKEISELPNTKKNFKLETFPGDLASSVIKVKGLCKSKLTCPADNKKTDVGLTAGCVKQLPEDPKGIQAVIEESGLEDVGKAKVRKKLDLDVEDEIEKE
ncbi:MAG: hypothetical protein LBQ87_07795 [Candidatus Fibromonas sp.]|nr:hypothetical protein [Candidatus Fibromonas sp.]